MEPLHSNENFINARKLHSITTSLENNINPNNGGKHMKSLIPMLMLLYAINTSVYAQNNTSETPTNRPKNGQECRDQITTETEKLITFLKKNAPVVDERGTQIYALDAFGEGFNANIMYADNGSKYLEIKCKYPDTKFDNKSKKFITNTIETTYLDINADGTLEARTDRDEDKPFYTIFYSSEEKDNFQKSFAKEFALMGYNSTISAINATIQKGNYLREK